MPAAVSISVGRDQLMALGHAPTGVVYRYFLKLITRADTKAKLLLSNDLVNVRSGNLRSSQQPPKVQQVGNLIVASMENTAKYARYVHDGTRPHDIRARRVKFLTGWTYRGMPVFTPLVHHPGTKARPWMKQALDEAIHEPS